MATLIVWLCQLSIALPYLFAAPFVPFGGYGQSGFGRENGVAALEHYTQTKSVFVNTDERLANPFE